jgi:hypothetical protein
MKTKSFDCVAMKREGSRRVYELTKDMTLEQELTFWRKKTAQLRRRQRELQRKGTGTNH